MYAGRVTYARSEGIGPLNVSWKSMSCQPHSSVSVKNRLSPRKSPWESVTDAPLAGWAFEKKSQYFFSKSVA